MSHRGTASKLGRYFGAALAISFPINSAVAAHYRVLYSFSGGIDGAYPAAALISDKKGNLYGTTFSGGLPPTSKDDSTGSGVVFRISPDGNYTVLHTFPPLPCDPPVRDNCLGWDSKRQDGASPESGLIQDQYGNLYGTTVYGGPANVGVVYRIDKDGRERVLHAFVGGKDGRNPYGNLLLDAQGNLYGTTSAGGGACPNPGCGTVFKIAPDGTETVVHAFAGGTSDGETPFAGLIVDGTGALYGTTLSGGPEGYGTIYSIAPDGTETVLFGFTGTSLTLPDSKLFLDNKGNLFGTTYDYQTTGTGGVFELRRDGRWNATHVFQAEDGEDGMLPTGVIKDATGNFFGTTMDGGQCNGFGYGCGVVFKMAPDGTETVLHTFGYLKDGMFPYDTLVADKKGRLYGTTEEGGTYNAGTVYRITP